MNAKLRCLALLPMISILLACRVFIPPAASIPTSGSSVSTENPSSTPSPTSPPTAAPTLTPTLPPLSLTPVRLSTGTRTPTPIPLEIQLSIFEDLWSIVNTTYVYPDFNGLDWDAIHEEYSQMIKNGLTNEQFYIELSVLISRLGDDHSFFLDPVQVAQQNAQLSGNYDYVGIGVMASPVPARHRAVILSVFPSSSAQDAGLKPRDSILSVDGNPILDGYGFLQDIVRGPEGTSVSLTVQTPGEKPRVLQLQRQRVTGTYPLVYQLITTPDGKRFGYILLSDFEDSTAELKVSQALQEMSTDAPLDGLILDNRMNIGGSNTVLEPMLSFFTGGNLGNFINRGEQRPLLIKLTDIKGSSRLPLVILIGSGTISFGEIFAGILQDVGRAYLIGTTTGGNVEILWGYDFEDGSQLWLANETFRPLNHPDQDWEKSGITPDLTIPADFDEYSMENDPAVIAALGYLSAR